MGKYDNHNAAQVLENVNRYIEELSRYGEKARIRSVCNDLSIFDWWPEYIGITGLKAMRSFLTNAIKMGFDGYVCFKVGAKGCASGMWAYKSQSKDGYSPDDGPCLYRSFYSSGNYYDARDDKGYWLGTDLPHDELKTIRQLKAAMVGNGII